MNKFEREVANKLESEGWTVLNSGWPDFLAIKKNAKGKWELKAVEVKSRGDSLRPNQCEMLDALSTILPVRIMVQGPGFGDNEKEIATLVFNHDDEIPGGWLGRKM